MAMSKNVKRSNKGSGAASPEVGAPTARYGKGQSRKNIKPEAPHDKGRKSY